MSFKMTCPHCSRGLNVTARAYGKEVPCPGCNKPISVPHPTELSQPPQPPIPAPVLQSDATQDGHISSVRSRSLPTGMPPIPEIGRAFDFVDQVTAKPPRLRPLLNGVSSQTLSDLFVGREKEDVFRLLPDEDVLGDVTIHHRHFSIVERGITRVTLTDQRLLYTCTRVFSPLYWLLVALFTPLIWYYVFRITRNRSSSILLSSVDSVEKRYFPNWALFILMLIVGNGIAALCNVALKQVIGESPVIAFGVSYILGGVLAVALLFLLLVTRGPRMEIRSGNNRFPISRRPGDIGGEEEELDAFFQKVNVEVHRAKMLQLPTRPIASPEVP